LVIATLVGESDAETATMDPSTTVRTDPAPGSPMRTLLPLSTTRDGDVACAPSAARPSCGRLAR
jgi:hypothetical protein